MSNSLVRLKGIPDKINKECQIVVKVQHKSKQFPIPIKNLKVKPNYFDENKFGGWVLKSYETSDGVQRNMTTLNSRIKTFKTKVDTALNHLEEIGIDTINVKIIKEAIGKSLAELKLEKDFIVDDFYNTELLAIYEKEFLKDPFIKKDERNFNALLLHLKNYTKTIKKPLLIRDFKSELLEDFTWFLLGYQFKKGKKDDPLNYLSHDTVYKQIKKLRRFYRFCTKEKRKKLPELKYKFPYEGTLKPLNPQSLYPIELDLIFYEKFPTKQLNNAKKLFLLAYSIGGQRISDISSLVKSKEYKKDIRNYFQQKTGRQIFSGLLDNYFKPFQKDDLILYTTKHINQLLKDLVVHFINKRNTDSAFMEFLKDNKFEDAFERNLSHKSYRGKSQTPIITDGIPLWKDFSFKYARSTFITSMIFKYKKTKEEVKLFTGHTTEKVIDFYLNVIGK